VLGGYFDDAHRGLQRGQSVPAIVKDAQAAVQLPPLRPNSGPPAPSEDRDVSGSWEKAGGSFQESKSFSVFDFSRDQALKGIQSEQFSQALQDSAKLARKVRALQDQLTITTAKKEAFKTQAQRLEREFRKGREQADALQKELIESKREAGECTREAHEAVSMMTEMRKAHIAEVKLLQRGLAQRGVGDPGSRNRVNEMADLVDKVGRAVVQRDEAIRDKTQMQGQLNKAMKDLRASADECTRLKKKCKSLSDALAEAKRKGQYKPPRVSTETGEDSDGEFEYELQQFEKRFEILEEGPAGLDVLASNLSKDKQDLEKRSRSQQETIRSLNNTIENWKALGAEKDQQITELSAKLEKVFKERALFEEQIAAKQREIADSVEEERKALHARIEELELECDNARAAADGMEKASTRLTRELVKVHEQYTGVAAPAPAADGAQPPADGTAPPGASSGARGEPVATAQGVEAKTGERLDMEVYKDGDFVELVVREGAGGQEHTIQLDVGLIKELDEADPWEDLFSRVGMDPGPQRRAVISTRLGEKEVSLGVDGTNGSPVLLTVYRYSARRFFLTGVDLMTQKVLNMSITEASLAPDLEAKLKACGSDAEIFEALASSLTVGADDGSLAMK